jgi:hypothetical protein
MQSNQTPTLIPLAWAANGTKNTIPEASQITITPGAASLNDGFPPICAIKVAAGGIAPAYGDFNGIFNLITQSIRWAHAGGRYTWNSAFTTDTNVAGYPNGACLMRADLTGFWLNTADNNETNPDATDGSAANWVPGYNYGVTPITGLTNANVTLTPAQAAKSKITLAGTLTGNVQIIFPTWTKEWEVVNNTTGTFTITAKTAAGTGIALAAGQQKITGDGTNITQPAESIAPATASQHAVQLGQLGVIRSQTGAGYTLASTDALATVRRSNSGAAMADTLPGTTPGVLPATWKVTIVNSDTTASDTISVGSGALLDGGSGVIIGPGQSLTIHSDGSNYYSERGLLRWTTEVLLTTVGAGNWIVPAGVYWIEVDGWGGGAATSGSSTSAAINGAGAGAYFKKLLAVVPGTSISYNVGAGGTAVAYGGTGGSGGTTTFNSGALSAGGGTGSSYTSIGGGGVASGGDINISGASGFPAPISQTSGYSGGAGGSSPRGGQGGSSGASASSNGGFPGGGAGGPGSGGANSGANGANGLIVIRY